MYRLLLLLFIGQCFFCRHLQAKEIPISDSGYYYVHDIVFSGNQITKSQIIVREMSFHAGDSIRKADLKEELIYNRRRILNLQLFSSVRFAVNETYNDSIDITFYVTEVLYWVPHPIFSLADRNINVWWKEQHHAADRTNIGLELTRMNFRGRNERIGGTAQLGYNKFFDLYYKVPYIDKILKRGLGLSFTYATGRETSVNTIHNKLAFYRNEEYPYRQFQTELTYTYRPAYSFVHEANLSYNSYSISDGLYTQNPNYLNGKRKLNYFEFKYTIGFNNTDIRIYPLNGLEARLFFSKKGLGIDKDVNQTSLRTEISYFQKAGRFLSAAFVFRGRLSSANRQPYILSRALGFRNEYLRGYEYYVIDGSHYALFRSNIRFRIIDKVIKQNVIKFMHLIPLRFYAKVYDDMGYVYSRHPGNNRFNNTFLNGYGVGLDIVISYYARFRIEYSFNHLGQNGLFLHGNKE